MISSRGRFLKIYRFLQLLNCYLSGGGRVRRGET